MQEFCFSDTDETGSAEYDIEGEDYAALIRSCLSYCKYMCFRMHEDLAEPIPRRMLEHRIPTSHEITDFYTRNVGNAVDLYTVVIYPELFEDICTVSRSVFAWIYGWNFRNPEDPAFFRHDGSAFFYSVIHEGLCFLNVRNDEDVDAIIANKAWKRNEIRTANSWPS